MAAAGMSFGRPCLLAVLMLVSACSHEEPLRSSAAVSKEILFAGPAEPVDTPSRLPPADPAPASDKLTLDRAIEEALLASPELDQVRRRIDAASEQVRQAEALFYPRIVFSEDYGLTNNPGSAFMTIINQRRFQPGIDFNNPGVQQNFSTRFQGELQLFSGGSRWFGRKAALSDQDAVAAELQGALNQLVAKTAETYYRWLQSLGFASVAGRALESAKVNEELGAERVRAQTALPSEATRLKVRTAEANADLVSARTATRRLQAGLERLIARAVRPEEVPDPAIELTRPEGEEPPGSKEALVAAALKSRPEIASAGALVRSARERVRSARSGFLPKISASALYEWDSEDFSRMEDSWIIGLQATWPLFEGGASLSRMREARARLAEMEARGRQIALDIALEVHQAALALEDAMESIRVAKARKEWAGQALEEVRRLYRDQVVTVEALLQAEVAANHADISCTAALFDGKIAQTALMRSLGAFTDWTEKQK